MSRLDLHSPLKFVPKFCLSKGLPLDVNYITGFILSGNRPPRVQLSIDKGSQSGSQRCDLTLHFSGLSGSWSAGLHLPAPHFFGTEGGNAGAG